MRTEMRLMIGALVALTAMTGLARAGETPAPEGAKVYFVQPADGDVVTNPVKVIFGLSGMGIAPAGTEKAKTGHHHLLINTGLPPLDEGIPADENHVHFGGGQTEVEITLSPGPHKLQLLLGDHNHIPHNPPVKSEVIEITVK